MASVADLVEEPALAQLVGPEALDAGREVADAGGVRLVEFGPMRVVAEVDDGDELPARVELTSSGGELGWRCDCEEGRTGLGCRHLAAAGIETSRRSPMRRA